MKMFNKQSSYRHSVILQGLILMTTVLTFFSCNEKAETEYEYHNSHALALDLTIAGWGDSKTRATYTAMSEGTGGNKVFGATFASGDAIGLFAVDSNGKVVIANHKWTYDGSSWTTETPIPYVKGLSSYTFFAYYPWVETLSGAPAVDSTPDITSADTFFGSAVTAWTPATDQSTLAAFTGSDLMIAKGVNSTPYFHEVNVSFTLAHQMALAVTQPDFTYYDIDDPSFTWTISQDFQTNIPYSIGTEKYYLVKPGVETTIGAKSVTLSARQVEQLYFTNTEPGKVEYDGEKKIICLGSSKLGSSPTYTYSLSTDNGSTFGSFNSTKPSWLTIENTTSGGYITKVGTTVTNSTSTSVSLGSGNARDVSADAALKAAASVSNVDLSMVDNAGNARASRMTANCYLVHAAGTYKIPLVYGNAIKNGSINSSAYYTAQTSNTLQRLVNHADVGITDPWIKTVVGSSPDGASLVWEDVKGMISTVGIDGDFLTFTVSSENIAEGNAVIAATLSGTTVWSWHIWVTDETLASLATINTGSHSYQVAPVNVGQVNGTTTTGATIYAGEQCKVRATANGVTMEFLVRAKNYASGGTAYYYPSPYYQWGRKDAMYPSTGGYNSAGTLISTYSGSTLITTTSATPGATIQHPNYWYNSSNYGPYGTNSTYAGKYNYWDMNQTSTGNITTATVKTVYDPCPPGFCVPTGNLYYYMGNTGSSHASYGTWQSTPPGRKWIYGGTNLFFPASGYCGNNGGALGSVGSSGFYWSASAYNDNYGHYLFFSSKNWDWNYYYRSVGFPVRAVAEE